MRTFYINHLHFMKNCIRPHYEKLKPLKSGFIENLIFENNRDPCPRLLLHGVLEISQLQLLGPRHLRLLLDHNALPSTYLSVFFATYRLSKD